MSGNRWRRAQQLFDEALSLPELERREFLEMECGDAQDLLHDVIELLATDSVIDSDFLEPPKPTPLRVSDRSEEAANRLIGAIVGSYKIRAVLGRGGMSTVYEAVQQRPKRVVALKVMRGNWFAEETLRRFEFESQILAHLQHPNIAQVYEAGIYTQGSEPVPYFAMEYVRHAKSIVDYANDRCLGLPQRLELFLAACDAVQHGHQRAIIHRDLKPGNILVNQLGCVKVIDFGVARATDSDVAATTMHTEVGQLVGTLQYMSPEQCDADPDALDIRSDVYSMGVVLYELLVGKLPYKTSGSSIYHATRMIMESTPPIPSSLNRRLRGDIDTIVLKVLEKNREHRYQSTTELAHDIRCYLNKEPIEARSPKPWERMARWVGRHPVMVTVVSCLAVGIFSLSVSTITVLYIDRAPHRIELDDGHHTLRLLARSGKELHTWHVQAPGRITEALLADFPEEYGGGKVALLGFSVSPTNEHAGQVCAFPVSKSEYDNPCWSAMIEPLDLPDKLAKMGKSVDLAGVKTLYFADIFPDVPGTEVVVIHDFGDSGVRAVRVLALFSGKVLYQVWHNGDFSAWHWLSGPRLLVLMGDNCDAFWDKRGKPDAIQNRPYVIFAIRPILGFRSNRFLPTHPSDNPGEPVWYRCLYYPFSKLSVGGFKLTTPSIAADVRRSVQFDFYVQGGKFDFYNQRGNFNSGVGWRIDSFGEMVPGSRYGNDYFNRDASLPSLEDFYFGELPPILPGTDRNPFRPIPNRPR